VVLDRRCDILIRSDGDAQNAESKHECRGQGTPYRD
jgi:hypothetical protein